MAPVCRNARLSASQLKSLRAHLKGGGVIAYPTESCYGLGCDPRNPRAVRKLLLLKGRPQSKGLILIGGKFSHLSPYFAPLSRPGREALMREWPGPVTFLVRASPHCPPWLRGAHHKIAIRMTAHPGAAMLCNALKTALVSTSANRSGAQPLKTFSACVRAFGKSIQVVRGRIGKRKKPSTIRDLDTGRIIRQ